MLNLNSSHILSIAAVASLSFSGIVNADMFPEHSKDKGIWQISFAGENFDQSGNLPRIDSIQNLNQTANSLTSPFFGTVDPQKHWGYAINAGYVLPSHKYDIQASYTWIRADENQSSNSFNSGSAKVRNGAINVKDEFNFSDVDATIGSYFKLTKRLMIRAGVGAEYVDIKQTENLTAGKGKGMVNFNSSGKISNQFKGGGPKFTFDGQFDLNRYFSIVGGMGISGVYGNSELKLQGTNGRNAKGGSGSFVQKEDKFVVGLDGNGGVRYNYLLHKHANLNLEIGYAADAYNDALQELNASFTSNSSSFGTIQAGGVSESNYFNWGPYFQAGLDFM